jgi:hypothetical protein
MTCLSDRDDLRARLHARLDEYAPVVPSDELRVLRLLVDCADDDAALAEALREIETAAMAAVVEADRAAGDPTAYGDFTAWGAGR